MLKECCSAQQQLADADAAHASHSTAAAALQSCCRRLPCHATPRHATAQDYRRRRAAQEREAAAAAAGASLESLFDGAGLSMGELPPGIDVDALLAGRAPELAQALGLSG